MPSAMLLRPTSVMLSQLVERSETCVYCCRCLQCKAEIDDLNSDETVHAVYDVSEAFVSNLPTAIR